MVTMKGRQSCRDKAVFGAAILVMAKLRLGVWALLGCYLRSQFLYTTKPHLQLYPFFSCLSLALQFFVNNKVSPQTLPKHAGHQLNSEVATSTKIRYKNNRETNHRQKSVEMAKVVIRFFCCLYEFFIAFNFLIISYGRD